MAIKVVELFAGVGGFRLGLEGWEGRSALSGYRKELDSKYKVVWSNQWEPSTKIQHASKVYEIKFGKEGHCNQDIATVATNEIPDHDLLVGGFPCQDYSVATTLYNSKGLIGKKGVLWWSIHRILEEKKKKKPKFLFLENVDRLLKSPANQRGRDFAVMLKSLNDLGYAVEWRVVNAAEYGMPQRRRRVFFLGYHKTSNIYRELKNTDQLEWLTSTGIFSRALPIQESFSGFKHFDLLGDLVSISDDFNLNGGRSPFQNTGLMLDGRVHTFKSHPNYDGPRRFLKDILEKGRIDDEYFIKDVDLPKWEYLKGGKKEVRKSSTGFNYNYSEGGMIFPDALDNASRTIITGEGGPSPSRFKHVVKTKKGLRRLTPIELERLNVFPDDHTKVDGISKTKRAFFMGNALVVGIVEKTGKELSQRIKI